MARTLQQIENDLAQVRERTAELDAEKDNKLKKTLVRCESGWFQTQEYKGCGMAFEIGTLTYIQDHYYIEPYSCTGGDYWVHGEGQFDCPHCGKRNRLLDERKEITELKHLFKDSVDAHNGKIDKD